MKPIALYYLGLLEKLRGAALGQGYALGLHGSVQRDLDLIAAPWSESAKPAESLVEALRVAVGGACHLPSVAERPHGRKCWVIYLPFREAASTPYIDLSVMPLASPPPPPKPAGPPP